MVSSRLLWQVERRLREVTPSAGPWKFAENGQVRPFGGINVIFMGDFLQLPPPDGGFLADIPHKFKVGNKEKVPDLVIEEGRELLWCGTVQGVTELVQKERCKDHWWNEVVDELRSGNLSISNWQYLHGHPVNGCELSREERESRRRVITDHNDPRLKLEKFKTAKAIVANNDARYQINKDRARAFAASAGTALRWSLAIDKAAVETLQSEACDKKTKIRWLQYHDRETGDLCGTLPLTIGMPVALTDHIDRGPKLLLRGRVGYVHSMVWPQHKKLPEVVFVQFLDADWQLSGTNRPGIYPIQPVRRVWYIDAGKPKPVLKVTRQQLPLCPAFCITAHTSQGKTLTAAILDMCVDKKIDVTFGTVTASRVRSRHDVLIFRPFPLWLYQRGAHLPKTKKPIETTSPPPKKKKKGASCKELAGPPPGVALLLEQLRGEHINWEEYRQSQRPTATCRDCNNIKGFEQFSEAEWEAVRANRPAICSTCFQGQDVAWRARTTKQCTSKHRCAQCRLHKIEAAFPRAQLEQEDAGKAQLCLQCINTEQWFKCDICKTEQIRTQFKSTVLTFPQGRCCLLCQEAASNRPRGAGRCGWFTCQGCKELLPLDTRSLRSRHCQNCSSRTTRSANIQTCRKCRQQWQEKMLQHQRSRLCPSCRGTQRGP